MNLWDKINDNAEDEEVFQKELSQSLQFEEQVKFQLKQLEKFIFGKKEIRVVNQISSDNSRNDRQHPGNVKLPTIDIKKFSGDPTN